jgi:hypothetical protein
VSVRENGLDKQIVCSLRQNSRIVITISSTKKGTKPSYKELAMNTSHVGCVSKLSSLPHTVFSSSYLRAISSGLLKFRVNF